MNKLKIIANMFSSWAYMACLTGVAFIVSPIMVHQLGNENYGLWTLIMSITGYFSILDFGINTAIVRFISMYLAQKRTKKARKIFSNAYFFFFGISMCIVLFSFCFGYFFYFLFDIKTLSHTYIYFVFLFAGIEFASTMFFGVLTGALHATQEFIWMNFVSIFTVILKNVILVLLLVSGYNLLTVAIVHLLASISRSFLRYMVIKIKHRYLFFKKSDFDKTIFKKLFGYSIYSFAIAVAIKIMFFTDSVIIGSMISVSEVTFYAIVMSLMTYLEQFAISGISVLTPIISSNEAVGDGGRNKNIYILCSKYSLSMVMPILFVLFTKGDAFISLWMGSEYGIRCAYIIKILSIGYLFYLTQVIAVELLKGISRHKVLAGILVAEAVLNLVLSVVLAQTMGIEGVALGTTIPLVAANFIIIPIYVCVVLDMSYYRYLLDSYAAALIFITALGFVFSQLPAFEITSYFQMAAYSLSILFVFGLWAFVFILEKHHRDIFLKKIRSRMNF